MAKSLGIFVTNPDNMKHVMGIAKAAKAKGSDIKVFFTWYGTKLTKDPQFPELCQIANVSICLDSYRKMGFDQNDIPEGLTADKMATQTQHGIIIEDYDCYISL
ncbi:MAG: peroxiredoxin [Desulfobulbaceae bacterium]|nr:peroxiredoxin [Desulfobulbaceae bacterium]